MKESLLPSILRHNAEFVASAQYEPYRTDRFPTKKMVVLSCMDTRLVELLPRAMDLRQGDAKIIKNAGAIVSHPFGSVMRSIIVAIYELGAAEVAVVGHYGCGMTGLSCQGIVEKARARGVPQSTFETLEHAGIDLVGWLRGFDKVEDGVLQSVRMIRQHPLLPPNTPVHALLMCPETGRLDLLEDGNAVLAGE